MVSDRGNEKPRTIRVTAPYAGTREPGLYVHMFLEDIDASFLHASKDAERRIHVEGDETAKASVAAICSSLADQGEVFLEETVNSAIQSIARRLAWYGEVVYEICDHGTDTSIANVAPRHLVHVPGGFVQVVLKKDRPFFTSRRWAFLPSSCAWVVKLPRCLGGPKAHRRLLNELTEVSRPAPEFWTRELNAGRIDPDFIFSDYNRTRDAYIAHLTRRWGWNRRDTSGTYDTPFFYFFRSLRLQQAHAILRDHIVDQINKLMARLRIDTCIRLEGFRSPREIEQIISQVSAGTLDYVEALRKIQ